MESILFALIGKDVEINCSISLGFRGRVESVDNGVVKLSDESGKVYYISSGSVAAVSEVTEAQLKPGFIA